MPPYPLIIHNIYVCVFPSTTLAFTGLAINASAISATSLTLSRPPFRMMLEKRKLFRKTRTIQWGYSFCDFKWETSVLPAQKSVNLRIIKKPATVVKNKSLWVYTPVLYIYTYFYIYTYAKYVYIYREREIIRSSLHLHSIPPDACFPRWSNSFTQLLTWNWWSRWIPLQPCAIAIVISLVIW